MKVTKIDDYQGWLFELGGLRFAMDPWLVGSLQIGGGHVFSREHKTPPACSPGTIGPLDGILLSAHFGDHLHVPTLRTLDMNTPIYGTSAAIRRTRRLGFRHGHALKKNTRLPLNDSVAIEAVAPRFPYAHNSVGFLISEDAPEGTKRIYIETHVINLSALSHLPRGIDLLIMPMQSASILGIRFSMGTECALRSAEILRPVTVAPTGLNPGNATGLLGSFLLKTTGTIATMDALLRAQGCHSALWNPAPGSSLTI